MAKIKLTKPTKELDLLIMLSKKYGSIAKVPHAVIIDAVSLEVATSKADLLDYTLEIHRLYEKICLINGMHDMHLDLEEFYASVSQGSDQIEASILRDRTIKSKADFLAHRDNRDAVGSECIINRNDID